VYKIYSQDLHNSFIIRIHTDKPT